MGKAYAGKNPYNDYILSVSRFGVSNWIRGGVLLACVGLMLCIAPIAAAQLLEVPKKPLRVETSSVEGGRIDVSTGLWRARYRLPEAPDAGVARGPEENLRHFASSFGWEPDHRDLRILSDVSSAGSRHVTWQQTYEDVPVFGRYVKLNLNRSDQASQIFSGYVPLDVGRGLRGATVTANTAVDLAKRAVTTGSADWSEPTMVVFPDEPVRYAWQVYVRPADRPAEYLVLVDAADQRIILAYDQASRHSTVKPDSDSKSFISGTGYVFDPDPLSRANVFYGPPFLDDNDENSPDLDAARSLVVLPDISVNGSGLFILDGPNVSITGETGSGGFTYSPPEEPSADLFRYSRNNRHFEAVNAYYHIDANQRYVQSLGFTDRRTDGVSVNPHGVTTDNSFYFHDENLILFGDGGVDDAEDATVVIHEYAHALLEAASPGLELSNEGSAYHEGWSDYWAAGYLRRQQEAGEPVRSDWKTLFKWDSGDGSIWAGRSLTATGHYPEDTCTDDPSPTNCSQHDDGVLWATTLMQIWDVLGGEVTDKLNLFSHSYLIRPMTFRDAAEALLQADIDHFNGSHLSVLLTILGNRGFLDASTLGPSIVHEPVTWREELGGTQQVEVDIFELASTVQRVSLFYKGSDAILSEVQFERTVNTTWRAFLPIPDSPQEIKYFIYALDEAGQEAYLPDNAPAGTLSFLTGPDLVLPQISHTPTQRISLLAWPPVIEAEVTDNLGIETAVVTYSINNNFAQPLAAGSFELTGDGSTFVGAFPVESSVIEDLSQVLYAIEAVDASVAGNRRRLPAEGYYLITVDADGLFRDDDFEHVSLAVSASGIWERGTPSFGLLTSHSGSNVFATNLDAPYPAQAGGHILDLAAINLAGVSGAILRFWHWYDFEHDGAADPARTNAQLWDGGNVKISTDGGVSWNVATPADGYRGTITAAPGNPLSGEPAFGGYSFGWRQEEILLPSASSVQVRFEAGFDNENSQPSVNYAGWFIDDISVSTLSIRDGGIPEAILLPDAVLELAAGSAAPVISAKFSDDNGVADAFIDYELTTSAGTSSGSVRMEMSPASVISFSAAVDEAAFSSAGDVLAYRLRVRDHMGNEALFRSESGDFEIQYRLIQTNDLLSTSTRSGIWTVGTSSWEISHDDPEVDLASIILKPIDLPLNLSSARMFMQHRYRFFGDVGGNVKLSIDGGRTWGVIDPVEAYPDILSVPGAHPMNMEPGFSGTQSSFIVSNFDLSQFAGKQIRLRLDYAAVRALASTEDWIVNNLLLEVIGENDTFDTPLEMALHANYPNPFETTTRIGYTIGEVGVVQIEMYDILGRLAMVLVDDIREAGTHEMTLDPGNLAGGMYLLRMRVSGKTISRPIVYRGR